MSILCAVAVPHPPIMLPEVGQGEEQKISHTFEAYDKAMAFVARYRPETVVIISPHADLYTDWFQISPGTGARGDFARFGAPGVRLEADYDEAMATAIGEEAESRMLPAGTLGERHPELDHGTLIPLYMLGRHYTGFKVVRVGLSGVPVAAHYRLGQCIAKAAKGKKVAVIASGDLSHKLLDEGPYGYVPEGPMLDKQITGALETADFAKLLTIDPALAEKGAECGLRSFIIMAGALDGRSVAPELLSYEGPFGVGYAVATFEPGDEDEGRYFLAEFEVAQKEHIARKRQAEDPWVKLARRTIESFVKTGVAKDLPPDLPAEMTGRCAGVFVTLHKLGELRGCIGTVEGLTGSVAEEIVKNAVSAASKDPRFQPVRPDELEDLEIHVDVLGAPEDISSEKELDPARYGVIVSSGGRVGLLLPDLDGVETVEQQIEIARRKAGIPPSAPLKLERFEVVRHE